MTYTSKIRFKKNIIFYCLCLSTLFLFSQGENNYDNNLNYAPSTPEVASLGKFVETPVSLYSGIPDISIPIGSVSNGSLSIPVSLSYHAGGIKVDEIASWAGLGWNLSAGGSITRVVRGIPDDATGGFLNTNETVQEFVDIPKNEENTGLLWDLVSRSVSGDLDYEPDMYHYSFSGGSGSFFMRQSGEVVVTPHTDIRIEPVKNTYNKITGWIITNTNGVKNYFGISKDKNRTGYEELLATVSLGGGKNYSEGYINSWKLMDIEDHTEKNSIHLSYIQNVYTTCSASSQQRFLNVQGTYAGTDRLTNGIKPVSYYESYISSFKIASITSSQGSIEFIKDTQERIDQPGDYRLKEIKIKDNFGKLLKSFELSHNQVGQIKNDYTVPCSGNERYYRMFLSSVQERNGNKTIPPYLFEYNSLQLPERYSYAKDFWGYYNGKHNNQSLIPSVTVSGHRFEAADKTADSNFSVAGILEKMTYPTGGYTLFGYEGNTVSQLAFARDIAPRAPYPLVSVNTTDVSSGGPVFEKPFTLAHNEIIEDIVHIDVNYPCDITQRTCGITVGIRKADNSIPPILLPIDTNITLPPGDYILYGRVMADDFGNYPDFSVRLYGETYDIGSITVDGVNFEVGGLRIKNIKKYDSPIRFFEKHYKYNSFNGNDNSSSGSLTSTPFFIEKNAIFLYPNFLGNTQADIITSSSNNPMTTTKSSYVGYSNITEYFGDHQNNNGKKEYVYSFGSDDDSQSQIFPFIPRNVLEWLRGNLMEERVFKRNQDNTYDTISKTINNYTYHRSNNDLFKKSERGIKMAKRIYYFYYSYYNTISEWYHLENSITTNYFNGEEVTSTKEIRFHENDSKHVFPIEETTSSSDGTKISKQTQYPEDLSIKTPAEQKLINQYRIASPIIVTNSKQQTGIPEVPISKARTIYKDWPNNLVLPEYIQSIKGIESSTNPIQDRVQYHSYDDQGNPEEVSLSNGTHIVYIWGYQNEFPIVKIENSSYEGMPTDVLDLIHQIRVISNDDDTEVEETAMRAQFKVLREHPFFKNSMLTAYTYDPLIGVTSITDPKGYTMYYHYDDFNRLKQVKDHEGHIISENEYNFKNN